MIEKELYIDVLEYLQDGGNWSQKLEIVEINSYKEIGNFIINDMLEKIPHTDNMKIKQIVCMYLNYSQPSDNGGYEKQEQEMVADWLSTKFLYKSMFFATIGTDKIDFEELLSILEQLTILYWLSLTIEFQIFDSVHTGDVPDYSLLTHPHPAVRLYYSLDAMQECILDIFNIYGFDDMQAEYGVEYIVNNIYILIESYLQITETPISIKKDDPQIMDCYITLRDVPYCSKVKDNYFHLIELPKEYRKSSEKYKRFFKNKNI